jgi:hypothetical protein
MPSAPVLFSLTFLFSLFVAAARINCKHILMKLLLTALLVPAIVAPTIAQSTKTLQQADIIIRHANVITMTDDKILPDQLVCINDNCISYLGPDNGLKDTKIKAEIVDATGQYLMPGMAEMHAHLPAPENLQNFFVMNLMAGITTVRSMRGKPEHLTLKAATPYPKPYLSLGAPIITHKTDLTPAAAEQLVKEYQQAGYDFIKVIAIKDVESFDNLMKFALQYKMPVCGHTPGNIPPAHLLKSGFDCIEHLGSYVGAYRKGKDSLQHVLQLTKQHNVYNDVTLDWYQVYYHQQPQTQLAQRYGVSMMHDTVQRNWNTEYAESRKQMPDSEIVKYREVQQIKLKVLKQLADIDAPILTGMDAEDPYMVPGFDIIEEMKLFKRAGLSNYQVLKAATITAAQYLKRDKEGTIAKGKHANLVLLAANPLDDINAVSKVQAVVLANTVYSTEKLKTYLN